MLGMGTYGASPRSYGSAYGDLDLDPRTLAQAYAGDAAWHAMNPELGEDRVEAPSKWSQWRRFFALLSRDPMQIQAANEEYYAPMRARTQKVLEHWGLGEAHVRQQKEREAEEKQAAAERNALLQRYAQQRAEERRLAMQLGRPVPKWELDRAAYDVVAPTPDLQAKIGPRPGPPPDIPDPGAVGPFDEAHPAPTIPGPTPMFDPLGTYAAKQEEREAAATRGYEARTPLVVSREEGVGGVRDRFGERGQRRAHEYRSEEATKRPPKPLPPGKAGRDFLATLRADKGASVEDRAQAITVVLRGHADGSAPLDPASLRLIQAEAQLLAAQLTRRQGR